MVDVETTGTMPHTAGIIQLAAIKFNFDTEEVSSDVFDRCPTLLPGRHWDDSTRDFWNGLPDVFQSLMARQELAPPVFNDFVGWVYKDQPRGGYRFWSKPLKFDWPILETHLHHLGLGMPFPHWQCRDLMTFVGACKSRGVERIDMPWLNQGPAHNALVDCANQIRTLFSAKHGVFHEVLCD